MFRVLMLPGNIGAFPSSHWSLISRARESDPAQARSALIQLCQIYWYPLYVFIRREVGSAHEAEDVTQGFFAYILENDVIKDADPKRGRFRSYLISCSKNYLANHRRSARTAKRGGNAIIMNFGTAANRYDREPVDHKDAEMLYFRRWAFTLLDETLATLEFGYRAEGRGELLALLKPTLSGDIDAQPYAEIGRTLNMSENAVKKAAQRLRARFGEELRLRVAHTVDDPKEVDDELRDLFAVVR